VSLIVGSNPTPSALTCLLMVSSELGSVISERYGSDAAAVDYLDQLRQLRDPAV